LRLHLKGPKETGRAKKLCPDSQRCALCSNKGYVALSDMSSWLRKVAMGCTHCYGHWRLRLPGRVIKTGDNSRRSKLLRARLLVKVAGFELKTISRQIGVHHIAQRREKHYFGKK